MSYEKKGYIIGLIFSICANLCSFKLGYSYGKFKRKNKIFTLGVPQEFSEDEVDYYGKEVMKMLELRNGEVSKEEYNEIIRQAISKTFESRSMTDSLFKTGEF